METKGINWGSTSHYFQIFRINIIFLGGGGEGGKFAPSWFSNTAQKLLGVGSWNFVIFTINV